MNFLLKTIADISFYMTFASFALTIFALPLAAILAPPALYLVYNSYSRINKKAGHFNYEPIFLLFVKIFIPFALLMAMFAREPLETSSLPFAIIFLTSAVTLMRTSRHQPNIQSQKQFRIMNLLPVAGILAAAALASSRPFLNFSARLLYLLYFSFLRPILLLFLYLVSWLLSPLYYFLVSLLDSQPRTRRIELVNLISNEHVLLEEGIEATPFAITLGTIIATALAAYLLIKLFQKLNLSQGEAIETEGITQQFIPLEQAAKAQKQEICQMRKIYRAFLKKQQRQAHLSSANYATTPQTKKLRTLYIPVRYGQKPATKSQIAQAKNLYKKIRSKD